MVVYFSQTICAQSTTHSNADDLPGRIKLDKRQIVIVDELIEVFAVKHHYVIWRGLPIRIRMLKHPLLDSYWAIRNSDLSIQSICSSTHSWILIEQFDFKAYTSLRTTQ